MFTDGRIHWTGEVWMISRGMRSLASIGAAVFVLAAPVSATASTPHAATASTGVTRGGHGMMPDGHRWVVTDTTDPSDQANYLIALKPFGANDMWAVGAWYRPDTSTPGTLTEHWNGTAWKMVKSPNATWGYNELYGVDGAAPDDVWAVGFHNISQYGSERTMALHWNGTRWSIVKTPNLGDAANLLGDVAVVSSDDAWAVGYGDDAGGFRGRAIALHWDGAAWSMANPKQPDRGAGFAAVDALASNDVWAVGSDGKAPLAEHYDGSTWSVVPTPDIEGELYAVEAIAPGDVWAAGESDDSTLIMHWNGGSWTVVPSPNGPMPGNQLADLVAAGPNRVWAVGTSYDDISVIYRTLVERWNGSEWKIVDSPNPDAEYSDLEGVTLAGGTLWTVGAEDRYTLAMHR
jgi:hypothetical protein